MNFTALTLLLTLAAAASSLPTQTLTAASPQCRQDCSYTEETRSTQLYFQHISDLKDSSVAPWTLDQDVDDNRDPSAIPKATCKSCMVSGMTARPILLEIYVYLKPRSGSRGWCRCPYTLAVGCTCVSEQ